jgi:hypothetical protein
MTEEKKNDFRERLAKDVKMAKSMLFKEEAKSAGMAVGFALNVACLVALPFTFLSVLNVLACLWVAKSFKGTVKNQIMYGETLKMLKTIKEDKVWTKGD